MAVPAGRRKVTRSILPVPPPSSFETVQWRTMESARAGQTILAPAPLFRIVADGVDTDHWESASPDNTATGAGLKVSGSVAGVSGLEATVEIARWPERLAGVPAHS